ncbi:MAG: hypothetical protein HWD59_10280 [Coxiellaceae bacterium]|nr:MAG: hypothetical protein HWD59_10280 [Coxiellaceae bacterium]
MRTNQITHNGIKHLCASIENNTAINELILANNIIGDKGARHLWALLKVNNTLTSLDISRNQITENCIDELKNALKENYSLTDLSLSLEDFNDNPATGDIKSYLKRNQLLRHNLFNAIIEEKSDEMLRLINQGVSLVCTSSLHKKDAFTFGSTPKKHQDDKIIS